MSELRALVFDFDGTIAETERYGHRVAYNEAFAELEMPERWDEGAYGELLAVAGGRERLISFFETVRPQLDAPAREKLARRVHEVKRRRFDALGPTLVPRPGILRLVEEAHASGIRLAIATTAAPQGVNAFFAGNARLGAAFDLVAGGDDAAEKKPAPDIYRFALDRLGMRPTEALAVEDSAIGLRAARAAGVVTLVTPSGYTEGEDFAGAAAILSDLGEPGRPARCIAGIEPPRGFVDVAYARRLLGAGEK
ncbi:MAG: HAD-IA family hydrolase [Candidatus Eremiobacteraeota bacterium]|nr:HAD-IA family hydrolase [Candidatus Eremiobacteraeota bacterium]